MPLRVVSGIIGLFFLLQGVNWAARPALAAEALGMPLLDGVARSTQIGDVGAFFLALGMLASWGAVRANGEWLRAGGLLLGLAAGLRILAWLVHDAALASVFIGVEVVCGSILLFAGSKLVAR